MTDVERRNVVTTLVDGVGMWGDGTDTTLLGVKVRLGLNWHKYVLNLRDDKFFAEQDMGEEVVRIATFGGEEYNTLTAIEIGGRTISAFEVLDLAS